MKPHLERRKSIRRRLCVPFVVWETDREKATGAGVERVTRDLSTSGLSFQSENLYSLNRTLLAEIYMPGRKSSIVAKLKVVSLEAVVGKNQYIIGAMFTDLKPQDSQFIASQIESMNIYAMLEEAVRSGASDLHLVVGYPPVLRIQGRIHSLKSAAPLEDGQIRAMMYPLLNQEKIDFFEKTRELNFAFSPNLDSRFRVNLHVQKGFVEAALRSVPAYVKTLEELSLPKKAIEDLCRQRAGLVLVAGKTGAGKTTTVAAMVDFINRHFERVIIAIEDPIEYVHKSQKGIVKQRELGSDTLSYAEALRHTLRQDPDVIVVGELLDTASVLAAIRAAETGHLVITTVHAPDTVQAIERIIHLFPPEQSAHIAQQLSTTLGGILFQVLLPTKSGSLIPATELLIKTAAVANLIREGQFTQIRTVIQTGSVFGMHTLESQLQKLLKDGLVESQGIKEFESRV